MNTAMKALALLAFCLLPLHGYALQFESGAGLLRKLNGSQPEVDAATGYVLGVHDAVESIGLVLRLARATRGLPSEVDTFCFESPPTGVKGRDIAAAVKLWLVRNPDQLGFEAGFLVPKALAEIFPCKR